MRKLSLGQIIISFIAAAVMIFCLSFILGMLSPKGKSIKTEEKSGEKVIPLNTDIDEDTLSKLKEFEEYRLLEVTPSNLGKKDIFKEER